MIRLVNQRIRLAKYLNKRQRFRATFSEIRHDKENYPEILLLDIFPVYKNGHKVPLRTKPVLIGKNGEQIVADHVWTKLTPSFLQLPTEVLYGDIIDFDALVTSYPINRNDVLNKRDDIWAEGKKESDQVYQEYQQYKSSILEAHYLAMQDAIQKAYDAYKNHLLTFQEMKREQKLLKRDYHKLATKAFNSMKAKQNRRIAKAQRKIDDLDLVDYGLSDITNINWYRKNKQVNQERIYYDCNRLNDLAYTKFLAAHSMTIKDQLLERSATVVASK